MDPLLPPPYPPPPMEPSPLAAPFIAQVPVDLPTLNHPTYPEMITAAITALKESDGSSRQAIAKYIERVYSELPPNHSALLTQHLKRMKNGGQLVMLKHSYKLPRSPTESQPEPAGNADPTPSTKRKPGRPPKPKGETPDSQPQFQFPADSVGQFPFHQPALPQFQAFAVPEAQNSAGIGHESVFASLGLVDAPAGHPPPPPAADTPATKRRPGRPKRIDSENEGPARALGVRRPGRPPKAGSGVVGRPKRNTSSTLTGKPRGRPKASAVAIAKKLARPGRPRGRPPKNSQLSSGGELVVVPITDNVGAPSNGAVPMPKRRGRPPRTFTNALLPGPKPKGRPPSSNADGKKPRKFSGKPLGRPRKNALVVVPNPPDSQHLAALQDLRGKLEQLKSRIKETASVIRPCLNSETAMAALQDLEAFAANEVNPVQSEPI